MGGKKRTSISVIYSDSKIPFFLWFFGGEISGWVGKDE